MLILSFLVVYQNYDVKQKKKQKQNKKTKMVVPQRFGLIIKWVDKVSLLFGRSERWYFVSISIFRLSVLPWATNCHVFNKIIGMLKRQIIGSKHGFLRITNILERNSRLVFTQFRLFRWHLRSRYNRLFWTQHFVHVWMK